MGQVTVTTSVPELRWLKQFRTGVSLHGHTFYSEECLSFLPTYLRYVPGLAGVVRRVEQGGTNFARAYWTPPLTPASALQVETRQIAGLGLRPMVSLTDHDSIDAAMILRVAADVPVSVEWTVPFRKSIFHFGIHNLPTSDAEEWMERMRAYTAAPDECRLPQILAALARIPEVLIVLNHPFWLEEGVRKEDHGPALECLLRGCLPSIHAFELNGTRPWKENSATIGLAREHGRPVVSGGDRHACEPSACINLTNARSFSAFVAEIRGGSSHVFFLPHYREPLSLRVLESVWDVLRLYPEYPDRERWTDRVFYRGDDGVARSLTEVWNGRIPWYCRPVTALLQCAALRTVRPALRLLLSRGAEELP